MSIKEVRTKTIDSGSALRHHSMSAHSIKLSLEGQKRLGHRLGIEEKRTTGKTKIKEMLLGSYIPLSEVFKARMLDFLIEQGRTRIADEENRGAAIPERLFHILVDVNRIYKEARELGLAANIADHDLMGIGKPLPIRTESFRYPQLVNMTAFLARFKTMQGWRFLDPAQQRFMAVTVPTVLLTNLCSADFRLPSEEQVVDRVQTYSHMLATLSIVSGLITGITPLAASDLVFGSYLKVATDYLKK